MKKNELDWLNKYAGELALIGFQKYLESGKGVVEIEIGIDKGAEFRYSRYHNLEEYDPNTQVLIKINDNPRTLFTHNSDMRKVHGEMVLGKESMQLLTTVPN